MPMRFVPTFRRSGVYAVGWPAAHSAVQLGVVDVSGAEAEPRAEGAGSCICRPGALVASGPASASSPAVSVQSRARPHNLQ